jgi:hypothetical protein
MSDDTHLLSRRNALKGIGAFAGTSAVGAGTIIRASEPAAAVEHVMSVDDITIETLDGEISELGISDMWVEVSWEYIPIELIMNLEFRHDDVDPFDLIDAGTRISLGVKGEGNEIFGYGERYEDNYTFDLSEVHVNIPFSVDEDLEIFNLDEGQDEKTVQDVAFRVALGSVVESGPDALLAQTVGEFDVTVTRVEPGGEADEGEGAAYGED